jgi:ATP/maltotriose-dependent transcriptional regulator MalT/DNA-binding SARP family transcriptional activator
VTLGSAATSSKRLVPRVPAATLPRLRLQQLLTGVLERRLTSVVAGTGFGKSTLLAAWAADRAVAWYTADRSDTDARLFAHGLTMALRVRAPGIALDPAVLAGGSPADDSNAAGLAGYLAESLADHARADVVLVVDDVHELDDSPSVALLAALTRHAPRQLHLVLLSQHDVPFPIARLRAQGEVIDVTATDLAFDASETGAVLRSVLGDGAVPDELATEVQRVTSGWPAAVLMAAAALRGQPAERRRGALDRLSRRGGALASLLAEEVFATLDAATIDAVRAAAMFDRVSIEQLAAMGIAGADVLVPLARGAVVVHDEAEPGWYAVPPLVRTYVREAWPIGGADTDRIVAGAAWLERRGALRDALAALRDAALWAAVADLLCRRWRELIAAGAATEVLGAISELPAGERAALAVVEIDARYAIGDWDGVTAAVAWFGEGPLPAPVALRAGLVCHLRGAIRDGVDMYTRGCEPADPAEPAATASIYAFRSAARWLLGDVADCRDDAAAAMELATACGDDAALAAAHTVAAMIAALDGDRAANQAHYLRALAHAEAAGDVLQIIRIRTNRGSRAIEEGAYDEGLDELDLAVGLAERSGYHTFAALALSNRAEAHLRRGRLDEAARDLEGAIERYTQLGSRLRAYPLCHLGDLHRLRGERAQARAAYEEALRLAAEAGDLQGLVPPMAGLVELCADEDPRLADRYLTQVMAIEPSLHRARVLWAAGRLVACAGDRPRVGELAAELAAVGRERRDRVAIAGALELEAIAVGDDRARARALLVEACELWRRMGEPAAEARALVALAARSEPPAAAELLDSASAIVQRLGLRSLADEIEQARRSLGPDRRAALRIVTLGGLRVLRAGEAIPATAWQSRKARDLLKLLVARLGRPTPRDQIYDLLWPDEPVGRRASRLSVTLSTLRGVLDPEHTRGADELVAADRENVWLDLAAVEVDVVRFLDAARRAVAGGVATPISELADVETLYTGEFLDDDPYADWAVGVREEARALYLQVARRLAERLAATGEPDRAGHLYLRLLQRDPFDEAAHLALVAVLDRAGHRGEARRAYRIYVERMTELDVEPAPFPV